MTGEMIHYRGSDDDTSGYLALPPSGSGPGVIVIQEWWGLVPHIKKIADRFANAGFIALAPDLYHGKSAKTPDEAGKLMMGMNVEQAGQDISGAAAYLMGHPRNSTGKVGTVGFCMGGAMSLYTAARNQNIKASVIFYGGHPNAQPDLPGLQVPVLGLYAEKDAFVTTAAVTDLDRRLTQLGKAHEFYTYPGANHGFFNDERPEVYDPSAAADAWQRTLDFFRAHLG